MLQHISNSPPPSVWLNSSRGCSFPFKDGHYLHNFISYEAEDPLTVSWFSSCIYQSHLDIGLEFHIKIVRVGWCLCILVLCHCNCRKTLASYPGSSPCQKAATFRHGKEPGYEARRTSLTWESATWGAGCLGMAGKAIIICFSFPWCRYCTLWGF